MVAERVAELLQALAQQGLDAPGAAQAIATVMAKIESDLKMDMQARPQLRDGKKWSDKVGKDENTFKYDGKSFEGTKGFSMWKWYFEMSVAHHEPHVHSRAPRGGD